MSDQISTDEAMNAAVDRRTLVRTGVAATAVAVGGMLMGPAAHAVSPPLKYRDIPEPGYLNLLGIDAGYDVQVLNYALTLEDLEWDLYVQSMMRLTVGGTNQVGTRITGLGIGFDQPDVFFINQFASVEAEHRAFLRGSLNGLIRGIATPYYKHDFGIESMSREQVLAMVLKAEALGTAAYLGAVPKLRTRAFITAAAAIQGTEARHTAVLTAVQNDLYNGSSPKPVAPLASDNNGIETPIAPDEVLAKVSKYIVK